MFQAEDSRVSLEPLRIAIIGGGPGGLMSAYQLQERCCFPLHLTIYESEPRLGGKILTKRFASVPVPYEAGAAELYDYSHLGADPLRELVQRLGLTVKPMSGTAVVLDGQVLHGLGDVGREFGERTLHALSAFDAKAKRWSTPQEYYESDWKEANADPMAIRTFQEVLEDVRDEAARRFLHVLVHSDVATEPHRTSAAYGLQNYLMNDLDYLRLYTIEGGIERLIQELAARVEARLRLQEPVVRVESAPSGLTVCSRRKGELRAEVYDYVIVALPNIYVPTIEWSGKLLSEAIHRHNTHYDHPAHYLRVSILFREVFWRDHFKESYLMLDAFGGCCLYDESSRNGCQTHGVLGWLLAGDAAMIAANHSDERLIEMVLDSLPSSLRHGRDLFLEGRVHRWIGSVNGLPGGFPALDMKARHVPQPALPNLLMVGDYLFDSTLNGVLDSANYVAESIAEAMNGKLAADKSKTLYSAVL